MHTLSTGGNPENKEVTVYCINVSLSVVYYYYIIPSQITQNACVRVHVHADSG